MSSIKFLKILLLSIVESAIITLLLEAEVNLFKIPDDLKNVDLLFNFWPNKLKLKY